MLHKIISIDIFFLENINLNHSIYIGCSSDVNQTTKNNYSGEALTGSKFAFRKYLILIDNLFLTK